ncbi:unnamed protein product [Protopolystoma xenopodis]|uniref:Uncharacterized protein n=1 Tax=Protopolystoma xenopodis TaxID=117903 RepID=A0A448W9W5_9PLAT|nr:unnamed protein product [Protopolystoma xenopodis]
MTKSRGLDSTARTAGREEGKDVRASRESGGPTREKEAGQPRPVARLRGLGRAGRTEGPTRLQPSLQIGGAFALRISLAYR